MSILMLMFAASSGHVSPLVPLAMVVMGIVVFVVGILKYREYRVLADTPSFRFAAFPWGSPMWPELRWEGSR